MDKEEGHGIGGVLVYTDRLFNYLQKSGHSVSILRFSNRKKKAENIYRIPYYVAESRSFVFLPTEKSLAVIKKHLLHLRPDIVYTSIGLSPLDFFLPALCHRLNIPISGVWHADFNGSQSSYQLLTKSLFLAYLPFIRQLDLLHVFSGKLKKFYIARKVDGRKIIVLPNGADPRFYSPGISAFGKRKKIKTGILFLGRLTLQKNPEALIRAFLELRPSPGIKLVIVGHGELENQLRERYESDNIIFTGLITDEVKKRDIIRSCQIFVLPSRFEGMPLALLEAMSTGLAAVGSDAGANSELLAGAGIVIPVSRINQELPLALRLCLDYADFRSALGRKARRRIQNSYCQDRIFQNLTSELISAARDFRPKAHTDKDLTDFNFRVSEKIKSVWKKVAALNV